MELKMRINRAISSAQNLGIFDISDEGKVRFIVQEAGGSNEITIRGRLKGQPNFIFLKTLTGSINEVVNVFTYEELEIECTVCDPLTDQIKIYAASFSEAGGSAIDSIDVPSGDPITDFTSLSFSSSDDSITITGDNVQKSIDFTTDSSIVPFSVDDPTKWQVEPSTIASAADELAARTTSLEVNKIDVTEKGSPDGVAPLNSLSKIDAAYLPSYVDDVEEYADLASFPIIGETSKIYVALDSNKTYRWSGSVYVEISQSLVTSVNGDVGDVLIPIDDKVNKIGDVMSGTLSVSVPATGTSNLGWQGVTSQSADFNQSSEYTLDGSSVQISDPGVSTLATTINPNYVTVSNNDIIAGTSQSIIMQSGQISLEINNGIATVPMTPTLPEHVTTKEYVDDQDALKEDVANKSTDGTLASNSDTLYPTEKAVKTYADSVASQIQSSLDASTYYHELHVNFDYTGAISDGSPYKPFKTIQSAVNAAQLQTSGANTAILIHLKKDTLVTENVVVNNAVANLYITPAISNNTDSSPIKITGSLTISGASTNRVRVKDLQFAPTSGYALIINDSNGRHMFQNCQFSNGAIPGAAGTGVNLTSTYKNFIEFIDCTVEGVLNIDGSPNPGTTVSLYRCRLGYANVIVNSANVSVGMYETYGLYGLTHTAGALAITGLWGTVSFFNSTANLTATNFLSLSNVTLQKYDLSFVALNKTGTCFYQLMNVHRGETADVLNGTRTVYGPTATDAGYKMAVSGNWSPSVPSVGSALDQLAQRVKAAETSTIGINDIITATKEPTGFVNRTDSTISFDSSTKTFSISPSATSYDVFVKGKKFTKTTSQIAILPPTAGNHFIFFNEDGLLSQTTTYTTSLFEDNALVSIVYWNTDTNTHSYFADERHGLVMDGASHSYLHTVFGARYLTGLALKDLTVDGTGTLDAEATYNADGGQIRDEDILFQISPSATFPVLYRQGSLWRKKPADGFPVIYNGTAGYTGTTIAYNEFIGGNWQLTETTNNNYVLIHMFATNDIQTPVIAILGTNQYANTPEARAGALVELASLTGLPFAEFVAIGTVIFQTSNSYSNTPKAITRSTAAGESYVDFRGTQLYTPAGTATTHSLLSGLSNDDHPQYLNNTRATDLFYTKTEIDNSVIYKNGTTPFAANQSMAGFKLTNLADPVSLTDAVNLQTLNASLGSSNDIREKSFVIYDDEATPISITDFKFENSTARSFNALVSVRIQATASLSETFEIRGIQKNSDWYISISSEGDSSGVAFSIDSSGQMYYTSSTYSGFIDGVIKFRAITTSV